MFLARAWVVDDITYPACEVLNTTIFLVDNAEKVTNELMQGLISLNMNPPQDMDIERNILYQEFWLLPKTSIHSAGHLYSAPG